jgi:glutaredoxin-like protein
MTMALLNASLRTELQNVLVALPHPVTLVVFVGAACETCEETRELVEELVLVSDGAVRIEVHDLDAHPPEAILYGIDKRPAIVVLGDENGRRDFGIRFYGSPAGYEFATLIEDIRMASRGTTDLSPATVETLNHLTTRLHLQVFVTPTCPYCPRAALLAHKMALVSDWVTADAVDATEFPELADQYHVRGVPRMIVNDTVHIEGAVPEAMLMAELIPIFESQAPPAS